MLSAPLNGMLDPIIDATQGLYQLPEVPTWLVDEDFDLNALNTSFMADTMGLYSCSTTEGENMSGYQPQPEAENSQNAKEDQARWVWFSYVRIDNATHLNPDTLSERTELDERDRQKLSQRLQQGMTAEPLPSTDFLVRPMLLVLYPCK